MSRPVDAKAIFQDALELPIGERAAFLDRACGGDAALRARVDALLAAEDEAGPFLATPTGNAIDAATPREQPGATIGHYKLQQQIGEGGFGIVWMAEQQQPVHRQVALKIVKRGMDSRSVVARFEQERQALAMMDHQNIAKVFDGGETPAGLPYFVMELVRGVPITHFCDQQHLDARERLSLFVQVCHAVQHAHQKGIIHRDLKPSNVLVTLHDGVPVPKVIDFGIAKAVHRPLTEKTLFTEFQQMIGTPEYMSPEQAELSGLDVDTRADIYALGVLLYELLTGTLPFDLRQLTEKGFVEMLRTIREVEPQKPSTRVGTPGADSDAVAKVRRTDTQRLGRLLRGDLDWIVMKALEKDRARRYVSADAFAADLMRHLRDEPVQARPPSPGYRLQKYVRRHRGRVLAITAVLATLIVGMIGTIWFAIDAGQQARRANAGRAEFDQVAAIVLYNRAVAAETELFPACPERVEKLTTWLQEERALLRRREQISLTLQRLEAGVRPASTAELQSDLEHQPRLAEWQHLCADVAAERRAQAVREGAPWHEPELPATLQTASAMQLGQWAWERVAPAGPERTVYDEQSLALAMVRTALARPESPQAPHIALLDTLARALFLNGRDTEALAAAQRMLELATPGTRAFYQKNLDELTALVAARAGESGRQHLARRESQLSALAAEVHARHTFVFDDPAQQFLHDSLRDIAAAIDALDAGPRLDVERRLRWARCIEGLTQNHPNAPTTWAEAAATAAAADGPYAGRGIVLRPQLGLVPIGKNPVTGLLEFYHLRSAWDGTSDPAAIPIPHHQADGSIPVGDDTGIVFVLLPGGRVAIGAQSEDPNGPNYDREAVSAMGPVRMVDLPPFLLARHEVTQGQWARLWSWEPTMREPSLSRAGQLLVGNDNLDANVVTYANPVEMVDWTSCDLLFRRHGLMLPTEAQWEYGCRAGSIGPWFCERNELVRYANLADQTALAANADWPAFEQWSDGCVLDCRVGRLRANRFGLFDMHGNVWEWCADARSAFNGADGERLSGETSRGICGGGFDSSAAQVRSAFRRNPPASLRSQNLGVRAAMALRR